MKLKFLVATLSIIAGVAACGSDSPTSLVSPRWPKWFYPGRHGPKERDFLFG